MLHYSGPQALLCLSALVGFACSDFHPSYDHQTVMYTADHKPANTSGLGVQLTPFFSPTYSTPTLVDLIQQAPAGSSLDIGTPGFDSWGNCTYANPSTGCCGCTIEQMKEEAFPVFPAVLNAIHQRGVSIRMLTNELGKTTCEGLIAPLDFLALNGVNIKYFTTTTFFHAKYMAVKPSSSKTSAQSGGTSGRKASVSSINFSHTSFIKNREAGMLVEGDSQQASELLDFMQSIFEFDFGQGEGYVVNNTYTPDQMRAIRDATPYPVVVPDPPSIPGQYMPPAPAPIALGSSDAVGITASPDYARQTLFGDLNHTRSSFQIMIYQITDYGLCDALISMKQKKGINVTVLVSSDIYSHFDKQGAQWCYQDLSKAGILPRLTPSYYTYSHQKFWIVDGKKVGMSTGNWSPSDYNWPREEHRKYPPYPSGDWQTANRDFTVTASSAGVVKVFDDLFNGDWQRGKDWYPGWCC